MRALPYAVLALLVVALPLALEGSGPLFVSSSYGASTVRFELLGMTGGAALLGLALASARRRAGRPWTEIVPAILPYLVTLQALVLLTEYPRKPFDYDCYEYAGRVLLAGGNIYRDGLIYLYPPLTAQLFALSYVAVQAVASLLGAALAPDAAWDVVHYLYQCAQVGLVLALFHLAAEVARRLGLASPWAEITVALLLVFDNPLLRTLRHGQLNLFVLDLSLAGALVAGSRPALAGLAIAVAGHLKLYPLTLGLPLVASGRWRAAVATGVAFVGIVALQTDLGRAPALWAEFLAFYANVGGEVALRNASAHSVIFNAIRLLDPTAAAAVANVAAKLASVLALAWLLARVAVRRGRGGMATAERDFQEDVADCLALALLVSPSTWEHHFVFALPLALVAIARAAAPHPVAGTVLPHPVWVGVALFLVFGMPTFDVFLLGYHRLVGLLGLLLLTSPGPLRTAWAGLRPVAPPGGLS